MWNVENCRPQHLLLLPPFRPLVEIPFCLTDFEQMTATSLLKIPRFRVLSSFDASVQPLELGVGLGMRLELGGLLQLTAPFSESEVGQSYRTHLNFVVDFLWFGCEYDPLGCLRQLVMATEGCVAYTAIVEGSISLLSGKPRGTRVSSCQTSRST